MCPHTEASGCMYLEVRKSDKQMTFGRSRRSKGYKKLFVARSIPKGAPKGAQQDRYTKKTSRRERLASTLS